MIKTYALLPARAGSKGVKNKNIRLLDGKPLIEYSIRAALNTPKFQRIIVTTDSTEIADLSLKLGAEVPFIRPSQFAQDSSSDRDYIIHALDWLKEQERMEPDLVAILRPTTPLRDPEVLSEAVQRLEDSFDSATSLRSVHPLAEPPQKMLQIENGWLMGFFPDDPRDDYFNLPRQQFPAAYQPNGYVDIIKTTYVRSERNKIFGTKMLGFQTPHSIEIDQEEDFSYLEYMFNKLKNR